MWHDAEAALEAALKRAGLPYEIDEGGGAFYGPKIDIKLKDALGRTWQCSTIQFDFNLPERFDLTYVGEDGKEHRPYMIHRALMGSMERFFGVMIEHFAGAFPVWLMPVQVRVIPVTERSNAYAEQVTARLQEAGIRAEADLSNERMNAKIRNAQLEKIPYMLIVGDREVEEGTVSLRTRTGEKQNNISLETFIERVQRVVAEKALI